MDAVLSGNRVVRYAVPVLVGIAVAWCAWAMFTGTMGVWWANQRLVGGLSSTVPEWACSWAYGGARPEAFWAGFEPVACLAAVACASFWSAGLNDAKGPRVLWMLNASLACAGLVAAGDLVPLVLTLVVHGVVWAFVAWRGGIRSHGWRGGPAKALGFGLVWLTGAGLAMSWLWDGALVGRAWTPPGGCGPAALVMGATGCLVLAYRRRPPVAAALLGAGLAGVGVWCSGFPDSAWLRGDFVLSPGLLDESHLRRALTDYRPDEREGSSARHPRPEFATIWALSPVLLRHAVAFGTEGEFLSGWLVADEAVYSPLSEPNRRGALNRAYALLAKNENGSDAGVLATMKAWVAYAGGDVVRASRDFEQALEAQPRDPMLWYGYGLALRSTGHTREANEAWCRWCLLDPRAVFSPAWRREMMRDSRQAVMGLWRAAAKRLSSRLEEGDAACLRRFVRWQRAWDDAGGNAEKFLVSTVAVSADDYDPTVAQVRERYRELLANQTDIRVGAFYSAAVALLTERHVSLGQCRRLHVIMAGSPDPVPGVSMDVLVSRPLMAGWSSVCSFREGGAGATPADFEENLVVRLLTYGWSRHLVKVPFAELQAANGPRADVNS